MTIQAHRFPLLARSGNFTRRRTQFLLAWSAMVILQMMGWPSQESPLVVILLLAGGNLGICYAARPELLRGYPISTSMLLGYVVSYFLLPPLATLLEWHPVTNNLEHPELVFVHAFVCMACLIGAHAWYRHSRVLWWLRRTMVERIYQPVGYYRVPGNLQLLVMGGIGLLAMAYQVFVVGSAMTEAMGAGNKLIQALYPLAFMPYCMVARPLMGARARKLAARWKLLLAAHTGIMLVVAMGNNSRSAVLIGITSVTLAYAYGMAIGMFPSRILRPRNLAIAAIGLWILQGPVADVATSMVIVRNQRADIKPAELVQETFRTLSDKRSIEAARKPDPVANSASTEWDEYYVSNLFLSRLCNLKFADETLALAVRQDLGSTQRIQSLEMQHLLSIFPRPIIDALGLPVDKDLVSTSSGGDLLLFANTNDYDALRGFRTGSLFASGYALFDWFYPLLLGVIVAFTFALMDANTTRRRVQPNEFHGQRWVPVFNPLQVVMYYAASFYLTSAASGVEAFSTLPFLFIRGWIETLLVYLFGFWVSRCVAALLGGKN